MTLSDVGEPQAAFAAEARRALHRDQHAGEGEQGREQRRPALRSPRSGCVSGGIRIGARNPDGSAHLAVPRSSCSRRQGRLDPLTLTSAAIPMVLTAIGSGLAGFEITSWCGLWVPAGTPTAVVQQLTDAVVKAFADPELRETWAKLEAEPGDRRPGRSRRSPTRTSRCG